MPDGRLPCLVPGCRRTLLPEEPGDDEGICAIHWRLLPPEPRRRYRRRRREYFTARHTDIAEAERLLHVIARLRRWLRKRAIERAVGL